MVSMAGISSSTGDTTLAIPAMTISISSVSMSAGTVAVKAKGNSSSTEVLVNNGDARDQPSHKATTNTGVAMLLTRTR